MMVDSYPEQEWIIVVIQQCDDLLMPIVIYLIEQTSWLQVL